MAGMAKSKTALRYRAADGATFNDKDAVVIGRELSRLGETITPHQVVDTARRPASPLHRFFEWQDSVAAEKFRLSQARHVVNHLTIEVKMPSGQVKPLKAFYSQMVEREDDDGEIVAERKYLSITLVQREPVSANNAITQAKSELLAWKVRWQDYSDYFGPVIDAIQTIRRKR